MYLKFGAIIFKSAKVRVSMDVEYLFGVRGACVDISQMPGPVFITRAPTACDAWNRNKPIILIFISATGNRATCAQVCTRPSMYAAVPLHPPLLGEPSQRLNACFAGSVDRPVVGDSEVTTLAALWWSRASRERRMHGHEAQRNGGLRWLECCANENKTASLLIVY